MAKIKPPIFNPTTAAKGIPLLRRPLPARIRPTITQVRKEKGGKAVMEADGTLKPIPQQSHAFWVTLPDGTIEERTWSPQLIPAMGVGATTPITYTPGNPSDIGQFIDLSANMLFSPAISPDAMTNDVNQGGTGDCFLLSTLNAITLEDPRQRGNWIKRSPGGGFDGFFVNNNTGVPFIVHGSGDIPYSYNRPNPVTGAMGVSLLEKFYCYARPFIEGGALNTYGAISFGWMQPVFTQMGWEAIDVSPFTANLTTVLRTALANKQPITFGTRGTITGGAPLIGAHAYAVYNVAVNGDATVINPWNFDGNGSDSDTGDGWLIVPFNQWQPNCSGIVIGTKALPVTDIPGDWNKDGVVDFLDLLFVSQNWGKPKLGGGVWGFAELVLTAQHFGEGR